MSKKISLETSVVNSISSEQLKIIPDIAEAGLDSFLDEGLLKELPAIKHLIGFIKAGKNIRDKLFLKKILLFHRELNNVPQENRKKFVDKMEKQENIRRRVGEALLLILERLDDMEKPVLIAKIFASYIKEEIDYTTMKRLITIVDRAVLSDLYFFAMFFDGIETGTHEHRTIYERLCGLGFLTVTGIGGEFLEKIGGSLFNYSMHEDGKLLHEIALKKNKAKA